MTQPQWSPSQGPHLGLVLLPHGQGEHGVEVRTGHGQHSPVGRDALLVGQQHHVTELAALSLIVQTLQNHACLLDAAVRLGGDTHTQTQTGTHTDRDTHTDVHKEGTHTEKHRPK